MGLFSYTDSSGRTVRDDPYDPAKPDYSRAPGTGKWDVSALKWGATGLPYQATATAATTPAATPAAANPFTPIANAKSPALTKLADAGSADLDKTRSGLNKSFEDWLTEFKATSATNKGLLDQSRVDMERDKAALGTDDFAARLAEIRSKIDAGINQGKDLAVSNLNRNMKFSALGGVYGGASGELADRAVRGFNDINVGAQLKLNEGSREDSRLLEEIRQRNIGRGTGLTRDYLAMANAYQASQGQPLEYQSRLAGTLSGLTSDQIRRNLETNFYGLQAPVQANVPAMPYYSGGQPNYRTGGGGQPFNQPFTQPFFNQPTGGRLYNTGGSTNGGMNRLMDTPQSMSPAEIAYYNQTGVWPTEDPNFSQQAWQNSGGRSGERPADVRSSAYYNLDAARERARLAMEEREQQRQMEQAAIWQAEEFNRPMMPPGSVPNSGNTPSGDLMDYLEPQPWQETVSEQPAGYAY